ncbi:MAG: DNA starvation/stationary phase protection protein [Chitinophagaceae bacterium]
MITSIGIDQKDLKEVAHLLNGLLADEFVLYTKTRNAHWNIEGPDFYNKHKFFEEQYQQLDQIVDDIAERIRSLGHYAPGTLALFLQLTHLTEQTMEKNDAEGFITSLLTDHESVIIHFRENIIPMAGKLHDAGTSDFITGLVEIHEKMAWMLKAHLR